MAEAISWGENLPSTFGVALYFASATTGMAFFGDEAVAMVVDIGVGGKKMMESVNGRVWRSSVASQPG